MAYAKDLQLPRVGQALDSAQVTHLGVSPGDSFAEGDVLLEIETDKSVIEVPAPEAGRLLDWLVAVDDTIDADTLIARVEVEGSPPAEEEERPEAKEPPTTASADSPLPRDPSPPAARAAAPTPPPAAPAATGNGPANSRVFATPAARRMARKLGVDVTTVNGSGPGGRIIRTDVEASAGRSGDAPSTQARQPPGEADQQVATAHGELHVRTLTPAVARTDIELVLIHGMFGDVDVWSATARAASRAGMRVVAVDLPCHGESTSDAACLEDIVEAVEQAIARTTAGPVALVGHSLGAAVATGIASSPGLRVHSLTLVSPLGLGTEINQSFLDGMVNAATIPALGRETRKLTLAGMMPSAEYLETVRRRLQDRTGPLTALCRAISRNGVQQVDISGPLAALQCPVTLIHGRDDAIVPWQHALNAPPRVALHLVPGVGHMPQWEAGSLTGELLQRNGFAA